MNIDFSLSNYNAKSTLEALTSGKQLIFKMDIMLVNKIQDDLNLKKS